MTMILSKTLIWNWWKMAIQSHQLTRKLNPLQPQSLISIHVWVFNHLSVYWTPCSLSSLWCKIVLFSGELIQVQFWLKTLHQLKSNEGCKFLATMGWFWAPLVDVLTTMTGMSLKSLHGGSLIFRSCDLLLGTLLDHAL